MNEMAKTYLRQARSFANAGDAQKAIDLLERAIVLVRTDRTLEAQVLDELCNAYENVGRSGDADRIRARLQRIASPAPPGEMPSLSPPPPMTRSGGSGRAVLITGVILCALAAIGGVWMWNNRPPAASTATASVPQPATPLAIAHEAPTAPLPLSAVPSTSPALAPARDALLQENVALVVIGVNYADQSTSIRIPIGSGTAFAVGVDGLMVTNRHVIDPPQEAQFPSSLSEHGLPLHTHRGKTILVCFSRTDRVEATVVYKSDAHDVAILKINRRFPSPLPLNFGTTKQGDDAFACGFPGIVQLTVNGTPKPEDLIPRYIATGKIDWIDTFSADAFNSTLTKGIVSQPQRNISGSSYVQFDASVSFGNSGGPLLDANNTVIGIVTSGVSAGNGNYNFALTPAQLRDELAANGIQ